MAVAACSAVAPSSITFASSRIGCISSSYHEHTSQAAACSRNRAAQGFALQVSWRLGFRRCQERLRRRGRFICNASVQVQQREALSLEECLERMRKAVGLEDLAGVEQINFTGRQQCWGLYGEWKSSWSLDRFQEKFASEDGIVDGGYDGKDRPWGRDHAGRLTRLDLDDRELCVVTAWLRSGYWLSADAQQKLKVELDPNTLPGASEQVFIVRLTNAKVLVRVHVNTDTWLVSSSRAKVFGGEDIREYSDWRSILPGRRYQYPCSIVRYPAGGGIENTWVDHADAGPFTPSLFAVPDAFVTPRDNRQATVIEFDDSVSPTIEMTKAPSGHYVIRPLLDGQDVGYFVVDTGASMISLAPGLAEEYGWRGFGELHVTGVESQKQSRFVRGHEFRIGPLKITNPLYTEVAMLDVVNGIGPIAGICGYDLFYSCIVEMSMRRRTLSLFNPSKYNYSKIKSWKPLHMLECVPHLRAKFNEHEGYFLLDTGAGGIDVIFTNNAVRRYKLLDSLSKTWGAQVRGVNASDSSGRQAVFGSLPSFEVCDHVFDNVQSLFLGGEGFVDSSPHTTGMICEHLISNFLMVLDYQRARIALVTEEEQQSRKQGGEAAKVFD